MAPSTAINYRSPTDTTPIYALDGIVCEVPDAQTWYQKPRRRKPSGVTLRPGFRQPKSGKRKSQARKS